MKKRVLNINPKLHYLDNIFLYLDITETLGTVFGLLSSDN